MTSNLGSEDIRAASPQLRALADTTKHRHQEYLRHMEGFNRQMYPILKASFQRDEFLGRINQIVVFLPLDTEEVNAFCPPIQDCY